MQARLCDLCQSLLAFSLIILSINVHYDIFQLLIFMCVCHLNDHSHRNYELHKIRHEDQHDILRS